MMGRVGDGWRGGRAGPLALVLLTACSGTGRTRLPGAGPRGPVTVFAAASLTEAFNDVRESLKSSMPGLSVTFSYGGSGALVTQVRQGAPADVVATADGGTMKQLADAGLVDTPVTFAQNRLEILVAAGNPRHVAGLADLARSDLKVVLADDSVPAGKYAAQALQAAGTRVRPVSREADVKAAVAKVTLGEADATVVYATDVQAAGTTGQGIGIPPATNVVAEYPMARVKATRNAAAAAAFMDAVVGEAGQDALARRGFSVGAGAR
jgi:molybdate transport system substrate-binding protein